MVTFFLTISDIQPLMDLSVHPLIYTFLTKAIMYAVAVGVATPLFVVMNRTRGELIPNNHPSTITTVKPAGQNKSKATRNQNVTGNANLGGSVLANDELMNALSATVHKTIEDTVKRTAAITMDPVGWSIRTDNDSSVPTATTSSSVPNENASTSYANPPSFNLGPGIRAMMGENVSNIPTSAANITTSIIRQVRLNRHTPPTHPPTFQDPDRETNYIYDASTRPYEVAAGGTVGIQYSYPDGSSSFSRGLGGASQATLNPNHLASEGVYDIKPVVIEHRNLIQKFMNRGIWGRAFKNALIYTSNGFVMFETGNTINYFRSEHNLACDLVQDDGINHLSPKYSSNPHAKKNGRNRNRNSQSLENSIKPKTPWISGTRENYKKIRDTCKELYHKVYMQEEESEEATYTSKDQKRIANNKRR